MSITPLFLKPFPHQVVDLPNRLELMSEDGVTLLTLESRSRGPWNRAVDINALHGKEVAIFDTENGTVSINDSILKSLFGEPGITKSIAEMGYVSKSGPEPKPRAKGKSKYTRKKKTRR